MTALQKLEAKNKENKFICVGLDTDINKIPAHVKSMPDPILQFNKEIINATKEHAAAFKINFAFYEKYGAEGFRILQDTISLIPQDVLIIGDAKRGDIGNTSEMYADAVYNFFRCDSITIHPYMGEDSVIPFLKNSGKLNFILALTSNPGAGDFEKLKLENGSYLFQEVIKKVKQWNKGSNCGIVFGATKIEELRDNINLFGQLPVLLPGVGAQGGNFDEVLDVFKNAGRKNFIVNISRGILYKSTDKDFAIVAEDEIMKLNSNAEVVFQDK